MRKLSTIAAAAAFFIVFTLLPGACRAQSGAGNNLASASSPNESTSLLPPALNFLSSDATSSAEIPPPPALGAANKSRQSLPRFGLGVKISTLGVGVEAATALAHRLNLRGGFNDFTYSRNFGNSGVNYDANLVLRSAEIHLDYFLIGGFHVSGGALIYNDNHASATASVPGGQTFTLNSVTYMSDAANPITGTGTLGLNKAAPTITFGFGNLLPRSHRHFSVDFELGAAFQGSPSIGVNLAGTACDSTGLNCVNAATDPTFQSNLQAQEKKISNDLSPFKYYPIISFGFGWKF